MATSNVMEASIGALWGEDPRYFRVPEESLGGRAKNVIKMTFLARRRDGNFAPAYARLFINRFRMDGEVRQYAQSMFLTRQLFHTRARSGVLVLAALFERKVQVIRTLWKDVGGDNS